MGDRRAALSVEERRARSAAATARLLALPELSAPAGRTIAGYIAVKGEIDPAAALARLAAGGASVALPRISATAPRLRFHRVDIAPLLPERLGPLTPGPFGLLEPAATAPEVAAEALEVVIVPGLAFDAAGRRLGFGGGYYDGAFADRREPGHAPRIGLAYDFQIVERCPADDADVGVDLVVTEARIVRAGAVPA
jgi:5-formyltetrahydrofolate cyclo-ligase